MTKNLTTYQAILIEFDTVCAETGWSVPAQDVMVKLAKGLDQIGRELNESDIECAVLGWGIGQGRNG